MSHFRFTAQNKKLDLAFSGKIFIILGFFTVMIMLTYITFRDSLLAGLTVFAASVILFIFYTRSPESITVEIDNDSVKISSTEINWKQITGWSILEGPELIEFIFQTQNSLQKYSNFYLPVSYEHLPQLIDFVSTKAPYIPDIYSSDPIQTLIKIVGLK